MINLSRAIGVEPSRLTLAEGQSAGKPMTSGDAGVTGSRPKFKELEWAFLNETIIFNSINKQTQMIMQAGWSFRFEKDETKRAYEAFLEGLGEFSSLSSMNNFFTLTFHNALIYGHSYFEIIYQKPKSMKNPIDLQPMDPKIVDYARDRAGTTVLNEKGKPVGYTYELGRGAKKNSDEIPKGVSVNPTQMFLKRDRILHIPLIEFGNGLHAVGLIESAITSAKRKHKVDEAQTTTVVTKASNPIIDYVGDENNYPTRDMIQKATENLSQMKHNRFFAVPHWHNIKPLEISQSDVVPEVIKALKHDISASLGVPLTISLGSGEETNRSTLESHLRFLETSLKFYVNSILEHIRNQIFTKISQHRGVKEIPKVVWKDIDVESKNAKADRLTSYTTGKVGILNPEDVRPYAIRSEQLDIYNKEDADNTSESQNSE